MGLLEKIFPRPKELKTEGYFKTLTAYSPAFTTYHGSIYEMELTRAAIHSYALLCSKLKPEIMGSAYKNLEKTLQFQPNPFMSTSQFLYRIATILQVDTTAFIVPLFADDMKTIVGYYPLLPSRVEIIEFQGEPWLRYSFSSGQKAAIEMSRVGILTKYQYSNDFFGDGNSALMPTLNLLDVQKQGMEEATRQSATIRFMAKVGNVLRPEDLEAERQRFSARNLSSENTTGVLIFDSKYSEVKQVDSKPYVIDAEQLKLIQNNVYNYFGTNENIIQSKYTEEEFNAYYEKEIEGFALQLGLALTNMTFTQREKAQNNQIMLTANRIAYASNNTKLQMTQRLFDRGLLTKNEAREIWQMKPLEDGDKAYIRLEYTDAKNLDKIQEVEENASETE
jgi:hypothetical protein